MGREDWYRRTTWTAEDEQVFFARLGRSRSAGHKAQYLRIQAHYLRGTGEPALVAAALKLLNLAVETYPDAREAGAVYHERGLCLVAQGRIAEALDALRASLKAERGFPNIKTEAYLDFGWLIVKDQRVAEYPEAAAVLEEFGGRELFPASHYRHHAIRALLAEAAGDREAAAAHARRALDWASRQESGAPYHPTLGLVRSLDPQVHGRLVALGGRLQ